MVKIRLTRVGSKNQPKFRIVVADEQFKRDGRFLEILGHYDTTTNPANIELNKERYNYWLEKGAQPTEAVYHLAKRK